MPASNLPLIVEENPLLGAWKLKAYVVRTAAGGPSEESAHAPYGGNPTGYLSYSADADITQWQG